MPDVRFDMKVVGLVAVVAICAGVGWLWATSTAPGEGTNRADEGTKVASADRTAREDDRGRARTDPGRTPDEQLDESEPFIVYEHQEQWDHAPKAERIAELEAMFEQAIEGIDGGADVRKNRARAEAALTALRAELYDTEEGRRHHRELEEKLDRR